MKKSAVLLILGAVLALITKTLSFDTCDYKKSYYLECYENNYCYDELYSRAQLDSQIVESLQRCGELDKNACDDFFDRSQGRLPFSYLDIWAYRETVQKNYNEKIYNSLKNTLNVHFAAMRDFALECKIGDEERWGMFYMTHVLDDLENIESLHWPNWKLAFDHDKWEQHDFDWRTALAELRRFGLNNIFFKEHVTLAYNDPNKLVIDLDAPELDKLFDKSIDLGVTLLKVNGIVEKEELKHYELLQKVESFIGQLNEIRQKHVNGTVAMPEIATLAQLKTKIPNFDWQKYFNALLRQSVDENTFKIQLKYSSYFQVLADLLTQADEKVINFYMLLNFGYYYQKFVIPRKSEMCDESVASYFSFGSNYFYRHVYQKDFQSLKESLESIFEALKNQFLNNLEKNKYNFQPETLSYLKEKLNKMELRVGTTPLELAPEFYNDFYKDVNITEYTSIVENFREIIRVRVDKQHELLLRTPTKEELDYAFAYDDDYKQPFEPFYVPKRNIIIVPQQFMMAPFMVHTAHKSFQFATTGFGIARAIIEAFMADGVIYDDQGFESAVGHQILEDVNYQRDMNCLRNYTAKFKGRLLDIPALQLVVDSIFDELPRNVHKVLKLHLYSDTNTNFHMRDLFFRFFGHYFRGSKKYGAEPLNKIVNQVPQFVKFYNCTAPAKYCSIW